MKRRLATILVADVVGYSGLMEADEEGTASRLAACRAIIDEQVAAHEGRVFKSMGDAVLAEFASPINAVRCAVAIRSRLALAEAEVPEPLRMRFGLHLADVMAEGEDLIGDGVNLAARIQQGAEPDAIEISAALFEQIRRASPFTFEDLGERRFRNIAEPVRVYRVAGEMPMHVYRVAPTRPEPQREKRPHSLAVLPIAPPPGTDGQRFLADGITEELIFELGRFRKLFVISRTASQAIAETSADPVEIGERLGVRYVLSGTIRQLGGRLRMNLSLGETETGSVVWTDRLTYSLDELGERLDEVVARVAATVLGRVEESDIEAARRARPESLTAYECFLRGLEYHRLGGITDENPRRAVEWFERAIEADPNFARAHAMWVCAASWLPECDFDECIRRGQRALELDPNAPEANRIMGAIRLLTGDYEAARHYHEKAMAMSPSDAYLKARSAAFYTYSGEPERALELLDEAEELDPFLPVWCVEERGAALYALGRFEEAIEGLRALSFQTRRSRLYTAASWVALGEVEQAGRVVREALVDAPDLTAEQVHEIEPYRDRQVVADLVERLVIAGLPQGAVAKAGG